MRSNIGVVSACLSLITGLAAGCGGNGTSPQKQDKPPTVSLVSPSGSTVQAGQVTLKAKATDDHGVVQVQFFVDSGLLFTDSQVPFETVWDTTGFADGPHQIKLVATDTAGQTGEAVRTLTLTGSSSGLAVTITAPAGGATVSGAVDVAVDVSGSGSASVSAVDLLAGSVDQGPKTAAPYTWSWDSCQNPDGVTTLKATAVGGTGQTTSATSTVVVANRTVAPTLAGSASGPTVTLTWTVPCPSSATGYAVYWAQTAGVTTSSTRVDATSSPYSQTGLTRGQTYYYRVAAVYPTGEGPLSNEVSVTVPQSGWSTAGPGTITVGDGYACALGDDQTLHCWGADAYDQLGDAASTDRTTPEKIGTHQWAEVSAGTYHTCAVDVSGGLWCWGDNTAAELGDGTFTARSVPTRIGTANWTAVSTATYHSCALKTDGTLWCWGLNDSGQLGVTGNAQDTPTEVSAGQTFISVSAGYGYTCAVRSDHTLWCFGAGSAGELGDGGTAGSTTPEQIGTATDWTQVAAGEGATTCGIHGSTGQVSCWGYNGGGEAGMGSAGSNILTPQDVPGLTGATWVAVGADQVCALAQGKLYCWGLNVAGTVGDGTTMMRPSPFQVGSASDWVDVDAGPRVTCGSHTDGSLSCWGAKGRGALGNGTRDDVSTPQSVADSWAHVSVGFLDACGIKTDGTLWCWGSAIEGALGLGTGVASTDVPVHVGAATTWTDVSLYAYDSTGCGIRSGGQLWCWGYNAKGQVGDGTITDRWAPVRIGSAGNWAKVAMGGSAACAVKRDGTLWCWGHGLGAGGNAPAQVGTATTWTPSLALGWDHACGIQSDGTLWCFGANAYGQVGNTSTTTASAPVQVGTATTWSKIAAGAYASCGVQTDGSLWCWGDNYNGQLGSSNLSGYETTPAEIDTSGWSDVFAGGETVFGVRTDGTLQTWGVNDQGQAGIGTFGSFLSPVFVPTQVPGPTSVVEVAPGSETTCAVSSGGTLACWGRGQEGLLADGTAWSTSP